MSGTNDALMLIVDQHNAMLDDMNKSLGGVKAYITELEDRNAALEKALQGLYDGCMEHPECQAVGLLLDRRGR